MFLLILGAIGILTCYAVGLYIHGADPSWDHWRVDQWILNRIPRLENEPENLAPVVTSLCNPGGWCYYTDNLCNWMFCSIKGDIVIPGAWFYELE